jgi:hypothetical protein
MPNSTPSPRSPSRCATGSRPRSTTSIRDRETLIAVGLLHDLVEDHGFPIEIVRKIFGKQVASSVWNMTKKMPITHGGTPIDIGFLKPGHGPIIVMQGGEAFRYIERDED